MRISLLRLTLSVLVLVVVNSQSRYLIGLLDVFGLIRSDFTEHYSHLKNKYTVAMTLFLFMGWVYVIVILSYGAVSRFLNGKLWWIRFVISALSYPIAFSIYWYNVSMRTSIALLWLNLIFIVRLD